MTLEEHLQKALDLESWQHYTPYTPINSRVAHCSVVACPNRAYAKGLCNAHYLRVRSGLDASKPLRCRKRFNFACSCGAQTNGKGGWEMCPRCFSVQRRKVLKQAMVAWMGGRCSVCNQIFPYYVFDFHHLGNKEGGISNMLQNASLKRIAHEGSKCILMCANCHREETYGTL